MERQAGGSVRTSPEIVPAHGVCCLSGLVPAVQSRDGSCFPCSGKPAPPTFPSACRAFADKLKNAAGKEQQAPIFFHVFSGQGMAMLANPYTIHPQPYILNPEPHTLRPITYTLIPTP